MLTTIAKDQNKRLFTTYIYYRLVMSVLLVALFTLGFGEPFLGTNNPTAFFYIGCLYIGICFTSVILMLWGALSMRSHHIILILLTDFISLIPLINSSTTISGLSYLLLIPMAIGGTFLRGKTSVALAAFASILLLANSILNILNHNNNDESLFTAGITATALFIAAIAFRLLSKKLEHSEALIEKESLRAEYLHDISQRIIETIQAGIVVIDSNLNTLLINNAAEKLLTNSSGFQEPQSIEPLKKTLLQWQKSQETPDETVVNIWENQSINIRFTKLPYSNISSLMLFVEDEKRINKEIQQRKLASLGRLTSSIAHEIRNPLGAISHASQLLDESENINTSDQELLGIIQTNSQRIDQTINNILQFSRRKQSSPEMINLCEWITQFKNSYSSPKRSQLVLSFEKTHIYGRIDKNHLQQIISNLVDNSFRHGQKKDDDSTYITVNINKLSKRPFIDITDEGDGIMNSDIDKIFEPFFTTKPSGSGLGLYLCRELCQANQADIIYIEKSDIQRSCFRLIFNESKQKASHNE